MTKACGALCEGTVQPKSEVDCSDCGLNPLCEILEYSEPHSGVPAGILIKRQTVKRGEILFRKGEPFHALSAVKSGSLKAYIPHPDQADQIVGFHLAGEVIGAEGMAKGVFPCTVRALENSHICTLYVDKLEQSGKSMDILQQAVIQLLGQEVAFGREQISTLVHQTAEQRLAGFVLDIMGRLNRKKMANQVAVLSMSRSDIGSNPPEAA